jgi:PAS domain S-box-containing protein
MPQGPGNRMRLRNETDVAEAGRLSLLASIVESADDAIIAKSLEGIITSWNRAAERMYGYSSEEIIGKSITLIAHADRPDEMNVILGKIRDGQQSAHYETVRVRKDGRAIAVSLTVSPIHDEDGAVIGASSIARDITESKQAFESARSMIEASLDSLVSISPEGKITDVNEATI